MAMGAAVSGVGDVTSEVSGEGVGEVIADEADTQKVCVHVDVLGARGGYLRGSGRRASFSSCLRTQASSSSLPPTLWTAPPHLQGTTGG